MAFALCEITIGSLETEIGARRDVGTGQGDNQEWCKREEQDRTMDKKKKNGVPARTAAEDKDSAAIKSAAPSKPLSKQAHTKLAPGSASTKATGNTKSGAADRDKKTTTTTTTPTGSKSNTAHAPDDTGSKQGPQKKRRKVTHGTALNLPTAACPLVVLPTTIWQPVVTPRDTHLLASLLVR